MSYCYNKQSPHYKYNTGKCQRRIIVIVHPKRSLLVVANPAESSRRLIALAFLVLY